MLSIIEDYIKELSYRLHGCECLGEGEQLKTTLQCLYFEKLFNVCVNSNNKVYVLIGKAVGDEQSLQPLFASFDKECLEDFKNNNLSNYSCFYIEECNLV